MSTRHSPTSKNSAIALIGRGAYVGSQFLFILLLTARFPVQVVGTYGLALAITGPLFALAQFDIRLLLSTNTSDGDSYHTHFLLIVLNALAALTISSFIGFFISWSAATHITLTTFLVALMKLIESITLLCYGAAQRQNNFPKIATSEILRGPVTLSLVYLATFMTSSLPTLLLVYAGCWGIILTFIDSRGVISAQSLVQWKNIPSAHFKKIYLEASPLGLRTVIISMLTNIPRYGIFYFHGEQMLGYFTPISYLLAALAFFTTLIRDLLAPYYTELSQGNKNAKLCFSSKAFFKMTLSLLLMNSFFYFFGKNLLLVLYGEDYARYSPELSLLILGFSAMAMYSFIDLILSIYRKTKKILIACALAFSANLVISLNCIPSYGIYGASIAYTLSAWILLLASLFFLLDHYGRSGVKHTP